MEREILKIKNEVEALLFAWGEPMEISELMRFFDCTKLEMIEILRTLEYEYSSRGIRLTISGNTCQISTNPIYGDIISSFGVKQKKKNLSNAAMETLGIIAYLQPPTKQIIEKLRGVKVDGMVQNLLEKNLIKEAGKLNQPGKPIVYRTTDEFLRLFEISSLAQLPDQLDREEIKKILKITEIDFEDYEELSEEAEVEYETK